VDDFLLVLGWSRLLEDDLLDRHLRRLAAVPEDPRLLAEGLVGERLLTRFQADNLLQGKYLRFFIGPYKVLDRIGCGGTGAVYLCEHHRLRRRVAVKVLLAAAARDETTRRRFEREARAASALNHPNLVRAFDLASEGDLHYLVMEHVDGVSLKQLLQAEGPLPPARAADYLRQAALGLQHAHEHGLIHRDLKPSNLMVDRAGVVKVLDLGLARFFEEGDDLTQGAVLGSTVYSAPEQLRESHGVDARADVYGVGATFYLCLTGKRPLPEALAGPPLRPPAADAVGFERLLRVLRRMLSPDPGDRYQTAAEVAAAAAGCLSPGPAAAARPAQPAAAAPSRGAAVWLWAAVVGLSLAAVLGLVLR
jgi:serine/threonine protein kinase